MKLNALLSAVAIATILTFDELEYCMPWAMDNPNYKICYSDNGIMSTGYKGINRDEILITDPDLYMKFMGLEASERNGSDMVINSKFSYGFAPFEWNVMETNGKEFRQRINLLQKGMLFADCHDIFQSHGQDYAEVLKNDTFEKSYPYSLPF
jgi:hypothetical protein